MKILFKGSGRTYEMIVSTVFNSAPFNSFKLIPFNVSNMVDNEGIFHSIGIVVNVKHIQLNYLTMKYTAQSCPICYVYVFSDLIKVIISLFYLSLFINWTQNCFAFCIMH